MKNNKKIVSIIICIAMVLSLAASMSVFADETDNNANENDNLLIETTVDESTDVSEDDITLEPIVEDTTEEPVVEESEDQTEEPSEPEATEPPAEEPTEESAETTESAEAGNVSEEEIKVQVNGNDVVFGEKDGKPLRGEGNRILVPLRKVGEAMNAAVAWRQTDNTVHIFKNGTSIMLTIGASEMEVRQFEIGEKFVYTSDPIPNMYIDPENHDVTTITVEDRAMVPLRAVGEALGATVDWDEATHTVIVDIPDVVLLLADKDAAELIQKWNYKPATELAEPPAPPAPTTEVVTVCVRYNFMNHPDASTLSGVSVTLAGETKSADAEGKCVFEAVAAGDYTVSVSGIPAGYKLQNEADLKVTVNPEDDVVVSVYIGLVKDAPVVSEENEDTADEQDADQADTKAEAGDSQNDDAEESAEAAKDESTADEKDAAADGKDDTK